MANFNVSDRVVFTNEDGEKFKGAITKIAKNGTLTIEFDDGDTERGIDPEDCKRLVKKTNGAANGEAKPTKKPARKAKRQTETMNKGDLLRAIAERAGLEPKQARDAFKALEELMAEALSEEGGQFVIHGIVKLRSIEREVKAIKKGTLVRNPFDGSTKKHPGRPASTKIVVKARALGHAVKAARGE